MLDRIKRALAIVVAGLFTPDLWRKAGKTLGQAFAGLLVLPSFINFDLALWKDALVAAGIGAITVVWNTVLVPAASVLWAKVKAALFAVESPTPSPENPTGGDVVPSA